MYLLSASYRRNLYSFKFDLSSKSANTFALSFFLTKILHILNIKIVNVFFISANFLAQSVKLMNQRSLSPSYFLSVPSGYSGIAAIASPSNVIPCPLNVITLTTKGFYPVP